jgi:hypothetical protein
MSGKYPHRLIVEHEDGKWLSTSGCNLGDSSLGASK